MDYQINTDSFNLFIPISEIIMGYTGIFDIVQTLILLGIIKEILIGALPFSVTAKWASSCSPACTAF